MILPREIIILIFRYIKPSQTLNLKLTNKEFKILSETVHYPHPTDLARFLTIPNYKKDLMYQLNRIIETIANEEMKEKYSKIIYRIEEFDEKDIMIEILKVLMVEIIARVTKEYYSRSVIVEN